MAKTTEMTVPAAPEQPTHLAIIQQAVASGQSLEYITALMGLSDRFELNQDKKAFKEAMVKFHANAPRIEKDTHVEFVNSRGQKTEYDHASLGNVAQLIGKALAEVGITHSWATVQTGNSITVTCTLSYGLYSESATLTAAPDDSGGKNSIQAVVSTKSYLERHTLTGITGMATNDQDDDGRASDAFHDAVVSDAVAQIKAAATLEDLKVIFQSAYKVADAAKDKASMKAYIDAKDARALELEEAEKAGWLAAINEAETVEAFNAQVLPLMRERGKEFKAYAANVAKARGYKADKASGLYVAGGA